MKNLIKFLRLHAKTIGIISFIGLIFILVALSGGKSAQIQKLLLQLKTQKVSNDIEIINHQISTNNDSIKNLDSSNAEHKIIIDQVVTANNEAQTKILDKKNTIDQLAEMYNKLNS